MKTLHFIAIVCLGMFALPVYGDMSESSPFIKGADGTIIGNDSDRLKVSSKSLIKSGGVYSDLTVGTSAVEVKVGGSRLSGRRVVTILPIGSTVYWGWNCSVTTATGTPIYKKQLIVFEVDDTGPICLIAASGSNSVRITEAP